MPNKVIEFAQIKWRIRQIAFWVNRFRSLLRAKALSGTFGETREGLAAEVDTSLPGKRVVRALDQIKAERGRPAMIVSDNGTELTSNAVLKWAEENGVEWHYIAPEAAVVFSATLPKQIRQLTKSG